MIRFTGYEVMAEKPHVSHLTQIFRAPCRKTALDWKNDWDLFNGLDVLYHHAKFGEDRTTRASCRCENMVFVCFLFYFCLSCSESGAFVFEVCRVQTSISSRFIRRFQCSFQLFHKGTFHKGTLFQMHYIVPISATWRHNFCEIAVKNFENTNNWR